VPHVPRRLQERAARVGLKAAPHTCARVTASYGARGCRGASTGGGSKHVLTSDFCVYVLGATLASPQLELRLPFVLDFATLLPFVAESLVSRL